MNRIIQSRPLAAAITIALGAMITATPATAAEEFDEFKVLIEINASDGDIGFHFLMDGDDLNSGQINDPDGAKVFQDQAKGPLTEQKLTETFAESAEPLCWPDPEADPDDEIVTLEEFLERWAAGTYLFTGMGDEGEKSEGGRWNGGATVRERFPTGNEEPHRGATVREHSRGDRKEFR